jgi:hypothetical protein
MDGAALRKADDRTKFKTVRVGIESLDWVRVSSFL